MLSRLLAFFLLPSAFALLVGPLAACTPTGSSPSLDEDIPVLSSTFTTPRDTSDNVDSPAVWHGPEGQHWLIATAKEGDVLRVHDATDGTPIQRVGGEGTALGQFDRPNGVFVIDDLVVVIERNNRRVQVLRLPEFTPLGIFGTDVLKRPYGLYVAPESADTYHLYVTDQYELPDERIPPDHALGERVRQFRFNVRGDTLQSEHVRAFGETSGPGVLHVVESLWGDPMNDRLLVAEEEEGDSKLIVYTMDGAFTGTVINASFFPHQAEGVVLRDCPDGGGLWVTTDQGEGVNTFHTFDRATLAPVGSFRVDGVLNTDGIALTSTAFGPFAAGAFYAVHDDGSTVGVDWATIAEALEYRCAG